VLRWPGSGATALVTLGLIGALLWVVLVRGNPHDQGAVVASPTPTSSPSESASPVPSASPLPGTEATIALPGQEEVYAVAADSNAVWVWGTDGLSRIDPATNDIVATVSLNGFGAGPLAVGEGGVWVGNEATGRIGRIDPD